MTGRAQDPMGTRARRAPRGRARYLVRMSALRRAIALVAALAAAGAGAQQGMGSGKSSVTPPPTKDDGRTAERSEAPISDPLMEPRHGLLGAPGAALDWAGPSRLGAPADRVRAQADVPDSWRAGDRVRSATSADVRAARQQQAPDLEWAAPGGATAPEAKPAPKKK